MQCDEETFAAVRDMVAEVLSVDIEEVTRSARFFADLGGESIDLLDLAFRIEKRLGVKVQLNNASPVGDIKTDADGNLTAEAIADIRARFPLLDGAELKVGEKPPQIQDVLTIGAIADYVGHLREQAAVASGTILPHHE